MITANAGNLDEATKFYRAISRVPKYARVSHLCMAYITENGDFDWVDDGEVGGGHALWKSMKLRNVKGQIVLLARMYGKIPLGFRRYEIISDLCTELLGEPVAHGNTAEPGLSNI